MKGKAPWIIHNMDPKYFKNIHLKKLYRQMTEKNEEKQNRDLCDIVSK